MIIYCAGPMRNLPLYGFDKFDRVKAELESQGHTVISPADIDRSMGFDPMTLPHDHDWSTIPDGLCLKTIVQRDIEALCKCDAIYMMPGWCNSKGALAELAVAEWLGLTVLYGSLT